MSRFGSYPAAIRRTKLKDSWQVSLSPRFKHKIRLSDIAILYRGNHQSRPLEKILRLNNLPYSISGGQSFFDRAEVKDTLAYLRLLINPDDNTAFLRIINTPCRHIGASTLEKLGLYASQRNVSLFKACHELGLSSVIGNRAMQHIQHFADIMDELEYQSRVETPDKTIRLLLQKIQYTEWLKKLSKDQLAADRRYKNIEELLNWVQRMAENDGLDLYEVIARITLLDRLDKHSGKNHTDMLNLMTLHAAKGLEFPHVYLIGLEEGLLPHQSSIDEGNIEEERRLAYVGITRAQRQLTLSYALKRRHSGKNFDCEPSRFLEELPNEHLQFNDNIPDEVKKETGQANIANLRAILNQR